MRWSWLIVLGSTGVVACTIDVSALRAPVLVGDAGVADVAHEEVAGDASADGGDAPAGDAPVQSISDTAADARQEDALPEDAQPDVIFGDVAAGDVDAFTPVYDASGVAEDGGGGGDVAPDDAQPDMSMDDGDMTDSLPLDAGDAGGADAYDVLQELPSDATPSRDGLAGEVIPEVDATAAHFCDPSDPTLAACYRFEGNTLDESSFAQATTATGASYQQGVAGQALHTGNGSSITVAESTSLDFTTAMTFELWARPASLPTGSGRAALIDNNAQYGLFIYAGGNVACTASGSSTATVQAVAISQWTHLACVFDGSASTLQLYVDGVLRATQNLPFSSLSTSTRDGTAIGRNNPSGDSFYGEIDGLRMWNVVRPAGLLCTTQATCG